MKRTGVIFPMSYDPVHLAAQDDELKERIEQQLEESRQKMATTFPGVRFMVTAYGAAPVAFEFDDDDIPLLERTLPQS